MQMTIGPEDARAQGQRSAREGEPWRIRRRLKPIRGEDPGCRHTWPPATSSLSIQRNCGEEATAGDRQYGTKRYLSIASCPWLHDVPLHRRSPVETVAIQLTVDLVNKHRGRFRQTGRALRSMASLDGRCIRALPELDPVAGTSSTAAEQKRDRVLTDEEMSAIWRATSGSGQLLLPSDRLPSPIQARRSGRGCCHSLDQTSTSSEWPSLVASS